MMQAIEYITHGQIDKQRWNDVIRRAHNGLAYAYTDFLDAMSPGWDALIAGNYEAVMPITWRKKMGIRYLCQPAFAQQLGIFSPSSIPPPLVEAFLRKASVHFRLIEIFLNHGNKTESACIQATNYILDLTPGYDVIRGRYRKDLMKNLTRAGKFGLMYKATDDHELAIRTYRSLYSKNLNLRDEDWQQLEKLCSIWISENRCLVREVWLGKNTERPDHLLAIGLFLKDEKRLYNIASSTLPNGRTLEANHFLFDQLIGEFAGTGCILDFEGSDLPGVARFYEKFGPVQQPYFFWKSNRLPAVLRWWKR
ncbi:MAG TPA: hypothetical protein VK907_08625 [Phnomibacter sp.]|nr:hypothetical protein [Phnomibacter sp.]